MTEPETKEQNKCSIEEKAAKKYPFTLNGKTYFSSDCYFDSTLLNGIDLELHSAKGLQNNENLLSFLPYSNRLIFSLGTNVVLYSSFKRKYEILGQCDKIVFLKADSLSTPEKEYVYWVEKVEENGVIIGDSVYKVCLYDLTLREKICEEEFEDIPNGEMDVFVFIHPIKTLGIVVYDQELDHSVIVFKKLRKFPDGEYFTEEERITLPYKLSFLQYDLESNSYFFRQSPTKLYLLRNTYISESESHSQANRDSEDSRGVQNHGLKVEKREQNFMVEKSNNKIDKKENGKMVTVKGEENKMNETTKQNDSSSKHNEPEQTQSQKDALKKENEGENKIQIEELLDITIGRLGSRKIVHFSISETYLLLLTVSEDNTERYFEFYSIFSYDLIFSQVVETGHEKLKQFKKKEYLMDMEHEESHEIEMEPINFIEFNKSVIIGLRGNSTDISIFSLYEQNLRHIRDTCLELDNCSNICRLFINPLSSEVIIISKHYELEGTLTTAQKSTKLIHEQKIVKKNFYLEISSFFITMEAAVVKVEKLGFQKKNYSYILTAPWLSEFYLQTENSIKSKRWEEKFDSQIICSAIHPMGQFMALGFKDCFKVYFLTYEKLIHTFFSENVKECISLSYSSMGNDFASATTCNIYIYDSFSYVKKHHIFLGVSYRIEEISYTMGFEEDHKKEILQCITANKRLVTYNVFKGYTEEFSFNPKSHIENTVVDSIMDLVQGKMGSGFYNSFDNSRDIDVVGLNKKYGSIVYDEKTQVVVFTLGSKIHFINAENFQSLGVFDFEEVSCIELCRELNTMFFGTVTGKIIAFPWPNKPINIMSKIPTYPTHRGKVRKIKVSSNFSNLISTSDESMYIHNLTIIHELRKVRKVELQREYCSQSSTALDFLLRNGICLFTQEKLEEKEELIKENEEESVNFNFILPEEREKQKKIMLNKLEQEKMRINEDMMAVGGPIKMEAIHLKDRIKNLEKSIKDNALSHTNQVRNEIQRYQTKIGELNKEKDELLIKHKEISSKNEKEIQMLKQELHKENIKAEAVFTMKLNQARSQAKQAENERLVQKNNFLELSEMDSENEIYSEELMAEIEKESNAILERNGYLMCRISNLEKDIASKRRKIEDTRDLIETTKRNIEKMPKKVYQGQKIIEDKEHDSINKRFAETERKYLKETKKLIEKNKAVNVSIEIYEKEREMLVVLEKKLEEEEKNIEDILDYILNEKENKKTIKDKEISIKEKFVKMQKICEHMNAKKIRLRNQLKDYLHNVSLVESGIMDLEKLKKMSEVEHGSSISTPYNIQMSIADKKKKIEKISSAEEKVANVQKNERKIYSNEKRKAIAQNQDLLMNFNFLSHQNKYLINVMKSQTDTRKNFSRGISSRKDNHKILNKPTPFETYINFRTSRRMKTTPCVQHDLSVTR